MKLTREQVEAMRESFDATGMTGSPMDQVCAELLAAWDREAKLRDALNNIDAVDPEAMIDGFSEHAIKGLVHCMGAIARAALGDTP